MVLQSRSIFMGPCPPTNCKLYLYAFFVRVQSEFFPYSLQQFSPACGLKSRRKRLALQGHRPFLIGQLSEIYIYRPSSGLHFSGHRIGYAIKVEEFLSRFYARFNFRIISLHKSLAQNILKKQIEGRAASDVTFEAEGVRVGKLGVHQMGPCTISHGHPFARVHREMSLRIVTAGTVGDDRGSGFDDVRFAVHQSEAYSTDHPAILRDQIGRQIFYRVS